MLQIGLCVVSSSARSWFDCHNEASVTPAASTSSILIVTLESSADGAGLRIWVGNCSVISVYPNAHQTSGRVHKHQG